MSPYSLLTWMEVQTFNSGLNTNTRQMIDAATGSILKTKTCEQAKELFWEIAMKNY